MITNLEAAKKAANEGCLVEAFTDEKGIHRFIFYNKDGTENTIRVSVPLMELESFIESVKKVENSDLTKAIGSVMKGFITSRAKLQRVIDTLKQLPEDAVIISMKNVNIMSDNIMAFDRTGKKICELKIPYDKDNLLSGAVNKW